MNIGSVQITIFFFIFFVTILFALVYAGIARRRKHLALRNLRAYDLLSRYVGEAIEANRPLHLSLGSAGIGGQETLLALAASEMFYYIAQDAAIGDVSPIVSVTDTSAIPLGQDTLRRAYKSRQLPDKYRASNVRWYAAGTRSMAYAAAITAMMPDDQIASHILAGSYGAELALILDSAYRHKQHVIAVSDQLTGQAIAFALADESLIGEEIFAAPGYLSDNPADRVETLTVDALRGLLILALLILMLVSVLGIGG